MIHKVMGQLAAAAVEVSAAGSQDVAAPTEASLAASLAAHLDSVWDVPFWMSIAAARLILIVATFVAAWLVMRVARYLIMSIGKRMLTHKLPDAARQRVQTLTELFFSITRYVVYFMAFITALYQANINPAPFLGGAAVVGLAVGFGSQDLVRDIVTGIFVLVENQFAIGDYIDLGVKAGVVTGMTVRVVTIRDDQGRLHNLPYRSINVVSNFSRSGAAMIFDVFLAKPADGPAADRVVSEALEGLSTELAPMIRAFTVEGVINPDTPLACLRVRINARPSRVDFVQAEVIARIKEVLASESIDLKSGLIRTYSVPQAAPQPVSFSG